MSFARKDTILSPINLNIVFGNKVILRSVQTIFHKKQFKSASIIYIQFTVDCRNHCRHIVSWRWRNSWPYLCETLKQQFFKISVFSLQWTTSKSVILLYVVSYATSNYYKNIATVPKQWHETHSRVIGDINCKVITRE